MEAVPIILSAAIAGALTYVFQTISVFLAVVMVIFMLTYISIEKD